MTGGSPNKPDIGFVLRYDDDEKKNVMFIQIPLESLAQDDPIKAAVSCIGWFGFCEREASAIVRMKRMDFQKREMERSKIIIPGAGLKVH